MMPYLHLADASEPSMHQNSRVPRLTAAAIRPIEPRRRSVAGRETYPACRRRCVPSDGHPRSSSCVRAGNVNDLTCDPSFYKNRIMKSTDVVKALSALAQDSRLAVFRLLVKRGPEGFTPGTLSEKLSIPAATLSFHLKELQNAGLVDMRRESRFLYYSARFDRMKDLVGFLTDQCCSQANEACDADCKPVATPPRRRSA